MLGDTEEVALSFEQSTIGSGNSLQTNRIRHPIAVFFHLLFRTSAVVVYILSTWFFSSFISIFVVMIVLLSMDFWTVKNITGRLLVGLRWWNHVDEDGKSHWIFENRKVINQTNLANSSSIESTVEVSLFWTSLFAVDVIWAVFFLIALLTFSFKWMVGAICCRCLGSNWRSLFDLFLIQVIILISLGFNASNTYGFLKCKYGSDSNLSSVASGMFGKQVLQSVRF